MEDTAWLGDFLGVRAETWLEFWLAVIPATLGGLFAVAVAFLAHHLGGRRDRRRRNEQAAATVRERLAQIADRGVQRSGPQFDRLAMDRAVSDWADTSVLPRRQAGNLGAAVLLWLRVWQHLHAAHNVDDEIPVRVHTRQQVLRQCDEAFFGIFAAWSNLTGRGKLAHWYFYDRTMALTRNLQNRQVSLLAAARTPELSGRMSVKEYEAPPRIWRLLIAVSDKLGRFQRIDPDPKGSSVDSRSSDRPAEAQAAPSSASINPTNTQRKHHSETECMSMNLGPETLTGLAIQHTASRFHTQRNL